jgi:hypothetical protein
MSDTYDRSSVLKIAFEELERARFLKTSNEKIAIRIGNEEAAPLYVTTVDDNNQETEDISYYDYAPLVSKLLPTLIAKFTVPLGKVFELDHIEASGENTAQYTVKIDGQVNKVKYSYYGASLNVDFFYNSLKILATKDVEIYVEHFVNDTPVDFHGTIEGRLKNE